MLLKGSWKNLNVIEVDKNKLVKHVLEHVINKGLENSRGVSEAKVRDSETVRGSVILVTDPGAMDLPSKAMISRGGIEG